MVRIWELGQDKPGWYQALLILAAMFPERSHAELASLTLGQRNHLLFGLRARVMGQRIDACVDCPRCGQKLEFSCEVKDLCPETLPPPGDDALRHVSVEGIALTLRAPTSADLEALSHHYLPPPQPRDLVCRCITSATLAQAALAPQVLDEAVLAAAADRLAELDPLAQRRLGLDCHDCGHSWSAAFDIAGFFWVELGTRVQTLLDEVHLLASRYGWREADILQLPPQRRQRYLERLA